MANEKKGKHPGGRPPRYTSVKQIEGLIEDYFKQCAGEPIMVTNPETGEMEPMLNKYGEPVVTGAKPPTVTGLALALGFTTRLGLLNYEGKPEFANTIKIAKSKVEEYAETRLFDRDGANGAKFSLANNFKGWSEKQEVKQQTELSGKDGEAIRTESAVQVYLPDNGRD